MVFASFLIIISIVILYFGAEFSLESSEVIGKKIGLSPLMIGMLLVGFGTSLPEFFVGHIAGVQGAAGIAVGSLVGSNIANMFLILGISGLLVNMNVSDKGIRKQLIVHFLLGLVLVYVLKQEFLNVITASPLIVICGLYLFLLLDDFKKSGQEMQKDEVEFKPSVVLVKLFGGFGMLYLGGELLVKGGTDLCLAIGISEYIVSAIFIAFGTSFPELVTSLMAAKKKKESDLIVGNIIGSNLFNCAFILGSLGIYEIKISGNYFYEMLAVSFGAGFLLFLSLIKKPFNKLGGIIFLSGYIGMIWVWIK